MGCIIMREKSAEEGAGQRRMGGRTRRPCPRLCESEQAGPWHLNYSWAGCVPSQSCGSNCLRCTGRKWTLCFFLGVLLFREFVVHTTGTITGELVYCVGCGGGNSCWLGSVASSVLMSAYLDRSGG